MDKSSVLLFRDTQGMTIKALIDGAKSGEDGSLTELYNQFFEKIYRFIYFRVGHKETAEDLAEEVFVKAFNKIHTVVQAEAFSGWLYQIAKNKIIDHYRKNTSNVSLDEVEHLLEYESNISIELDSESYKKQILEALNQLSREQRIVIQMKFFDDLDTTQISIALGKPEGSIRVIQHRALQLLKRILNP